MPSRFGFENTTAVRIGTRIETVLERGHVIQSNAPDLTRPAGKAISSTTSPSQQGRLGRASARTALLANPGVHAGALREAWAGARALELVVLTAMRTDAVIGAKPAEFDLEQGARRRQRD